MTDDSQATRIMSEIRSGVIAPGSLLRDRYRLESEIGRGGMGIVYRATDLEPMREVAIKVLPGALSSPDARQRLMRESPRRSLSKSPTHSFCPRHWRS